jgi:hypothetical protein
MYYIAMIVAVILFVCMLISLGALFASPFIAAKYRHQNVSYFSAIMPKNLLFYPHLYSEQAAPLAKLHLLRAWGQN